MSQSAAPGAASAAPGGGSGDGSDALNLERVYHDPAVPELVCRYPGEPVVTVLRAEPKEVTVAFAGKEARVVVRNGQIARPGRDYLMIREGDDKGLWLLLEPGDEL
jgi:hypothetical protein